MKDMDKFWKRAEKIFRKQFDNRKTVWSGYAISFVCIALAILVVCLTAWRHKEFTFKIMEITVVLSILGFIGFVFCFFRKTAPIRLKFYTACLIMASFSAYVLFFHPEATAPRYPYPEFNRAIDFAGIIFFGGGGLWILYNDLRWHRKGKSKIGR